MDGAPPTVPLPEEDDEEEEEEEDEEEEDEDEDNEATDLDEETCMDVGNDGGEKVSRCSARVWVMSNTLSCHIEHAFCFAAADKYDVWSSKEQSADSFLSIWM